MSDSARLGASRRVSPNSLANLKSGWAPGQSGNPGGRPKSSVDIAALAREHAPAAIAALERALRDPKQYVAAAIALLDRGFGRPVQAVKADDDAASFTFLHLVAAREVVRQINEERTIAGSVVAPETNRGAASPSNGPNTPPNLWEPADE